MADIFTKRKRFAVMSLIRAHGNRDTELRLVTMMRAHGTEAQRGETRGIWKKLVAPVG